ncbi:MAG: hypothetical protein WKG07_17035 [Hymenobacter sp.]
MINVSGHRFGTAEIENAINQSDYVVESAVVGYPHDVKGQGIYAYVICRERPAHHRPRSCKWPKPASSRPWWPQLAASPSPIKFSS